jgi:hypothetical protein
VAGALVVRAADKTLTFQISAGGPPLAFGPRWEMPTIKENLMSSGRSDFLSRRLVRGVYGFRLGEFLIKSTPTMTAAFLVYVTFKGILW